MLTVSAKLILDLRPANKRRRYVVTTSLIDWAQAWDQPWSYIASPKRYLPIIWHDIDGLVQYCGIPSAKVLSGDTTVLCYRYVDWKPGAWGRTVTLHWRHNDHDGVSNHQPHGCLLNRLFRRRSKKTSKLHVTGLCVGNSPGPVNSPHKGPVTRKMFPFDDVIMNWISSRIVLAWRLID